MEFLDLGIQPDINQKLKGYGLSHPTPIQEKAIPLILRQKDVIAQAQTGTGKTLAFLLPMLQLVDSKQPQIQALVITPTRELAIQVTAEVEKLISADMHVLSVYGGQDVEQQLRKLQGAQHIVIGTPGRLLDHLRRGTIHLSGLSVLILDEADQMLHMGFLNEVEEIIEQTPSNRQTLLFSATMPASIRQLAKRLLRQPEEVRVKSAQITVKDIKQYVVETTDRAKQDMLCRMIDVYRPFLAIIFCRTKRRASKLNAVLLERGYNSDELHGDLSQSKREEVMKRFREYQIQLLVATDVAARGLDVEGITHVFNYDIPHDAESYIHRIGRTGRAGGKGLAITLVAPKDRVYLQIIEKGIQQAIPKKVWENPSLEDVNQGKTNQKKASQNKSSHNQSSQHKPGHQRRGVIKKSIHR